MNPEGSKPKSTSTGSKLLIAAVVAVVLGGGGLLGWRLWFTGPPKPSWLTQKVYRGNVAQVVNATGTLQPVVLSPVGAQVSGIVWKIHADYNAPVKKGQVLVELDPALFEAAVRQQEANTAQAVAALAKSRADLSNAVITATRSKALAEKHYISLADRDTAVASEASARAAVIGAEANIKQAQASLDQARLNLKNSVVLSPVDGTVIARSVELGQAVVASFQAPNLFTIAENLSKMQVLANVDEADIGHVRLGAVAEFTVDAFRGRRFHAVVSQIRNAAQTVSNVVTYIVVLDVDNTDQALRPGMTANVKLEVAKRKDVLLIPAAALRFKPRLDQIKGGREGHRGRGRRNRDGGGDWQPGEGHGDHAEKGAGDTPEKADKPEKTDKPEKGAVAAEAVPTEAYKPGDSPPIETASPATIYTPDGELVDAVHVVIGVSDGNVTEVREGLQEGQVIVTDVAKQGGGGGGGQGGPGGGQRGPGGGGGFRRGGL